MSYTLLDLTQTILSSMDSDEVNSISDTTESYQVATIIRSTYEDILVRADLPEHKGLVSLSASGDTAKPIKMTVPSNVRNIIWVKYNKETSDDTDMAYQNVSYLAPETFLERMYQLRESDDGVETFTDTINSSSINFLYTNDAGPMFYTSFDDQALYFNSYDSEVDTTLQSSKTLCYAHLAIPFTMSDTFTPSLTDAQWALLRNEAEASCWAKLRQTTNAKAETTARRHWVSLQKKKTTVRGLTEFDKLPHYGRK